MAYGTTVLDEEHRANCLYFMAVMFALSSADAPTLAQRELNISTRDLVYYFRVDGVPWSAGQIMSMFVELLESLSCTCQGLFIHPMPRICFLLITCTAEAISCRKEKLKHLLHPDGSGLPNLDSLLKKARLNFGSSGDANDGLVAAIDSLSSFRDCKGISAELLLLNVCRPTAPRDWRLFVTTERSVPCSPCTTRAAGTTRSSLAASAKTSPTLKTYSILCTRVCGAPKKAIRFSAACKAANSSARAFVFTHIARTSTARNRCCFFDFCSAAEVADASQCSLLHITGAVEFGKTEHARRLVSG
jgi:hypothetical protein